DRQPPSRNLESKASATTELVGIAVIEARYIRDERSAGTTWLRLVARRGVATLAVLVLAGCAALAVLTTMSRRGAEDINALDDALRAVDALRIELSTSAREGALAYATPERALKWQSRGDVDRELLDRLATARAVVREPHQRELLQEGDRRIHE